MRLFFLYSAARQGFEPRYLGPKPSVLPLDDRAIYYVYIAFATFYILPYFWKKIKNLKLLNQSTITCVLNKKSLTRLRGFSLNLSHFAKKSGTIHKIYTPFNNKKQGLFFINLHNLDDSKF